jgi:hypothetical protein
MRVRVPGVHLQKYEKINQLYMRAIFCVIGAHVYGVHSHISIFDSKRTTGTNTMHVRPRQQHSKFRHAHIRMFASPSQARALSSTRSESIILWKVRESFTLTKSLIRDRFDFKMPHNPHPLKIVCV